LEDVNIDEPSRSIKDGRFLSHQNECFFPKDSAPLSQLTKACANTCSFYSVDYSLRPKYLRRLIKYLCHYKTKLEFGNFN